MSTILDGKRLVLGTCYYPEHWPEQMWEPDIERMLETGIEVIRIAEFAWSKTEPVEGQFTYDFFDRFLDLCDKHGMKVIFGTPTATPPAWLTEKYPEVLNADLEGTLYRHGARRHYNYNSLVYQTLSARIVRKLAEHYAGRKCIIGWQLDNELNCEREWFYSEADTMAFRLFLRDKYGTLDALNEAWGTVFWNQTYTAWEEIHVPRKTISDSTNPHEVLDYIRFISESARRFAKMQSDILHEYLKPGDFITTNGMFSNLDNHQMNAESLDFYTYDSYPNFAYCLDMYRDDPDDLKDRRWSRNLCEVRSISERFGIMEQQSGANGWNTRMEAPTPRPGQMTLWTMQSIAHGADFISYFRWRTSTIGTEIYWHGILDYSNRENRRIAEVRTIHAKLARMQEIAGARVQAGVALLKDYDNVFDARVDKWHARFDWASEQALFNASQKTHTPMNYLYLDHTTADEMAAYPVIFYPHPVIMTRERAELLEAYVKQGGTLVLGCRSAFKDMNGKCVMDRLPGLLSGLTQADVLEYSFIAPDAGTVTVDWDGTRLEAAVFTDLVEAVGTGVLEGTYTSDYYAGSGALVSNTVGKGRVYYYGTAFSEQAACVFLEKLGVMTPYSDVLELPPSCELSVRKNEKGTFLFILNYLNKTARIRLKKPCTDVLSGEQVSGETEIADYDVLILKI